MTLSRTLPKTAGSFRRRQLSSGALRCRRKFLHFFPDAFRDDKYIAWERGYKWQAHQQWNDLLNQPVYARLLSENKFEEIAASGVGLESRTNLLFSFEKMALRDAVKPREGAKLFARSLYEFLHGRESAQVRFERWCEAVAALPRKQTRVLTWPIVTIFGFLAQPAKQIFLKPNVTRSAAVEYEFPFEYASQPNWETYSSLLAFAKTIREDVRDLRPRDMLDVQSFIWVQGSSEYEE